MTELNNGVNKKYWEQFVKLYEDNSKVTFDNFFKGEVAMAIFPLSQLIDSDYLSYYGEIDKSNFGIAPMPVFEEKKVL